jgi:hypothetical protein
LRKNDGSPCPPRACHEIRDGTACRLMNRISVHVGDYGVLHRRLEAVESKEKARHCSNTADYCGKALFTIVHCSLHCSLFTVLFTIFIDFSLSKSVDSDSATAELGTQQRMVAK